MELVSVVDAVIDALQRQEGFFCFTLDGQAILLEDYLTMRPEQAEIVGNLVRGGNLLVGPWYTQPDEFLVSGESLVRNLQAGMQTAAHYGGSIHLQPIVLSDWCQPAARRLWWLPRARSSPPLR